MSTLDPKEDKFSAVSAEDLPPEHEEFTKEDVLAVFGDVPDEDGVFIDCRGELNFVYTEDD